MGGRGLVQPNTIYHGDCLEVMRTWPDACCDLVFVEEGRRGSQDRTAICDHRRAGIAMRLGAATVGDGATGVGLTRPGRREWERGTRVRQALEKNRRFRR